MFKKYLCTLENNRLDKLSPDDANLPPVSYRPPRLNPLLGKLPTRRYFADGGGVEAVEVVAVARLHEDGGVREAVGEDLALEEAQLDA